MRRVVCLIPVGRIDDGNAWAAEHDPAGGGGLTFGRVELSSDGTNYTHTGCNTLMSDATYDAMIRDWGDDPDVRIYVLGRAVDPDDPEAQAWSWRLAMEDAGLVQLREGE